MTAPGLPSAPPAPPLAAAQTRRSLVVVHNPSTGRFRGGELARFLDQELARAYDLQLFGTTPDGDLAAALAPHLDDAAAVLACGGDGTVNAAASLLVGRATPLAILPAGTTNIIAQGLGIPADPFAVCRMLRGDAITVPIDVAQVGERYLLHMGGAGYDAQVMAMTNRNFKRGFGLGAYLLFGARGLFDQPIVDFTILVDGHPIHERGWMALVANGGDIAVRGLRIGPNISSTDGLLDLCLFTAPSPWDAIVSFLSILARHYRSPYLRYARGRQIEVHADPPIPVEIDGDPLGQTPFIAEILPLALNVLVPAPGSGGLLGPWLRRALPALGTLNPTGVLPPDATP